MTTDIPPSVTPPGKSVTVARVSLWPHIISREGRERRDWKRGLGEDRRTFPMTRCRAALNYFLMKSSILYLRLNIWPCTSCFIDFNERSIYVLKYLWNILQMSIIHFIYWEAWSRVVCFDANLLINQLKILADNSKTTACLADGIKTTSMLMEKVSQWPNINICLQWHSIIKWFVTC